MANVPNSGVVAKLAVPELSKRVPERSKRVPERSERVPERSKRVPEHSNLDDKNRAVLWTFPQFFLTYFSWEKGSSGPPSQLHYIPGQSCK
ncbi:hypothetical protein AVEN_86750-1 [Araneus ventricosus]|uniref:Uncharacterized protein n=1 Tax=Araneus ventricosus TaxID=182803 RepID=A0A4Y2MG19_ARAVE|nr:hypothetical protein AVEN_86750-1 [Araneus ventricosus]